MSEDKIVEATETVASVEAFHPTRAACDCERLGLDKDAECIHGDPCWESEAAYLRGSGVTIRLDLADARALYDHTGTMPFAPGSWSNNLRATLSEALHTGGSAASGKDSP